MDNKKIVRQQEKAKSTHYKNKPVFGRKIDRNCINAGITNQFIGHMKLLQPNHFLGVRVDEATQSLAIDRVHSFIDNSDLCKQVVFTNVHSIFLSLKDQALKESINNSDMVLADGSGISIAGKMLGRPIQENLNGTDFIPVVCEHAARENWSIYLLGSKERTVRRCFINLKLRYPALNICGYRDGYFSNEQDEEIIKEINEKQPDILLVALGSPKQEKWINQNRHRINAKISFAVGGLFDFISGDLPRAPLWMRRMGIEWLFRFLQSPAEKWERIFIEIPVFIPLIFFRQFLPDKLRSLTAGRNI